MATHENDTAIQLPTTITLIIANKPVRHHRNQHFCIYLAGTPRLHTQAQISSWDYIEYMFF